ncbi:CTP synthetase [Marinibacterium profundimaris]|uniref:CTP synthetase n=1 Tax=Marinibacterium profundimaris TaxID=1679460 RepID=UPI00117DB157|nr:CTP synthetase [Marinibacterium profundimaris]
MLPLTLIIHIFTGATLSGTAIVLALVLGATTAAAIIGAAIAGFLIAFPASWWIAKTIRANTIPSAR